MFNFLSKPRRFERSADQGRNAALNIRNKGILELKVAGQSFLLMGTASDSILSSID